MQFSYNSDHPDIDPYSGSSLPRVYDDGTGQKKSKVRNPGEFPNVAPVPCARITTRVYHPVRNETMTVQNVLVRTVPTSTTEQQNRQRSSGIGDSNQIMSGSMEFDDDDDNDSFMSSSEEESEFGMDDYGLQQRQRDNGRVEKKGETGVGFRNEYAYWTQRTIRDAIYGRVLFATILRKRRPNEIIPSTTLITQQAPFNQQTTTAIPDWIVTDQYCAVKEMSWQHIRKERDRLAEDPIKEVAAMQYIKAYFDSHQRYNKEQHRQQEQLQQQQLQLLQEQQKLLFMQQQQVNFTKNSNQLLPEFNSQKEVASGVLSVSSQSPLYPVSMSTIGTSTAPTLTESSYSSTALESLSDPELDYDSPISTFHAMLQTNVMMPLDLLSDERYMYSIMPFCDGGELFERLDLNEQFTEDEARYWMKQILNGIETLQKAGICHRDISLENVLVHKDTGALVIDMGMCLLLPYEESPPATVALSLQQPPEQQILSPSVSSTLSDYNTIAASLENMNLVQHHHQPPPPPSQPFNGQIPRRAISQTPFDDAKVISKSIDYVAVPINRRLCQRFLVAPQGTCGKWIYMSPEILKNKEPFDGYAVDMWAAGVILFLMLTGFPPWERACLTDERFKYMSGGYLVQMLTEWEVGISGDALDLLQRMLFYDPKDRLSLDQVRAHPWMIRGNRPNSIG